MTPVCKHCGEPIEHHPFISNNPNLQWKHANGYYGCNKGQPRNPVTYAEPEVTA